MKKLLLLVAICTFFVFRCAEEEEPFFCHLTGWVLNEDSADSTGVNDIIVDVIDINPEDCALTRQRQATTRTEDSTLGYFEIDSVCYGTSQKQGTGYVTLRVDSLDNLGWETRMWAPDIYGEEDTVVLYIGH
jgi:hypothetical protein